MAVNRGNTNGLRSSALNSNPTRLPALPRPRSLDPEMQRFIDAVVENLEVRNGSRGDPVDKGVTFRDLQALDHDASLRSARLEDAVSDLEMDPIPAPVGLEANGGPGFIELKWLVPDYAKHQHTEIWSSKSQDFTQASQVGVSRTTAFLDFVGFAETRHYWIRYVNVQDDKGVFSPEPVSAETGTWEGDPWDWTEIEAWLENHLLYQAISSPIDPVSIPEIPAGSLIRLRDIMRRWGMSFADMDKHVDAGTRYVEDLLFGEGQSGIEAREEFYSKYGDRVGAVEFVNRAVTTEREATSEISSRLVAALLGMEGHEAVFNNLTTGKVNEYNAELESLREGMAKFGPATGSFIENLRSFADDIEAVTQKHSQLFAQYGGTCADGDAVYGSEKPIESVAEYPGVVDAEGNQTREMQGLAEVNCTGHGLVAADFVRIAGTSGKYDGTWRVSRKLTNDAFVLGRSFNGNAMGTATKLLSGDCAARGWATMVERAEAGASYKDAWAEYTRQLYATFGDSSANFLQNIWAKANGEGAIVTKIEELEARDPNDLDARAAIQEVSQVIAGGSSWPEGGNFFFPSNPTSGLAAMQFVKTDVNGKYAGYGLYSDSKTSAFIIAADKFAIGSAGNVPFKVDTVDNKVYIEDTIIKSLHAGKITGDVCTRAIEVFGSPNYSLPTWWYDISAKDLPAPTHPGGHYPVATISVYVTSMSSDGKSWANGGLELRLKIPGGQTTTQGVQWFGQAMVPISYASYYSITYRDNYILSVKKTLGVDVRLAIGSCICWGMR